jgi:hypothetical protein
MSMIAVLLAVASTACANDDPAPAGPLPYGHAYVQRVCAPWDGPAVALYLADHPAEAAIVPPPVAVVTLYQSAARIVGRRIRVTPDTDQDGVALWCLAETHCDMLPEGAIRFERLDEEQPAQGTVELRHADGRVEAGRFEAEWLAPADLCG